MEREEDRKEEEEGGKDKKRKGMKKEVQKAHKRSVGRISWKLRFSNWVHSFINKNPFNT